MGAERPGEMLWGDLWGPTVRVPGSHCQGLGSVPGRGTDIPQATRCHQKQEKKEKKIL